MSEIKLLQGDCLELMKDMTNDEWREFKLKTKTTSTYFV